MKSFKTLGTKILKKERLESCFGVNVLFMFNQ